MDKKALESLKASFYGWEFAVEHSLPPEILGEDIENLNWLFNSFEELKNKVERYEVEYQFLRASFEHQTDSAVKGWEKSIKYEKALREIVNKHYNDKTGEIARKALID